MDTKIIIAPSKYIQGNGLLSKLNEYTNHLGHSLFILVSKNGKSRVEKTIQENFRESKQEIEFVTFNGECSSNEINRLRGLVKSHRSEIILGIGGGKIIDTVKAVAYYEKLPVVIVPTIAATDAPCSALSVIYTDQGVFQEYLVLPKNPDVVLVDTQIIAEAPSRLLVAGMGDALSTYFEARACSRSNASNIAGGKSTKAALALARLCYETLLEDGLNARLAVERKVSTKAVENIIEANTLLSGMGFESGGLAAAHAIHNGLTTMKECHHLYHGEKVAFGTITQLVLENSPSHEIEEVFGFCMDVGLPVTLEDLNIKNIVEGDLMNAATASCAEGETIHNMPFKVTPKDVYAAILAADAIGRHYKNNRLRLD